MRCELPRNIKTLCWPYHSNLCVHMSNWLLWRHWDMDLPDILFVRSIWIYIISLKVMCGTMPLPIFCSSFSKNLCWKLRVWLIWKSGEQTMLDVPYYMYNMPKFIKLFELYSKPISVVWRLCVILYTQQLNCKLCQ